MKYIKCKGSKINNYTVVYYKILICIIKPKNQTNYLTAKQPQFFVKI